MKYITLDLAAELSGLSYETLKKAHQRGNFKTRSREDGQVEILVASLLEVYPDARELFSLRLTEKGMFRYHKRHGQDKTHISTKDPTKVMTEVDIKTVTIRLCQDAKTETEKRRVCEAMQEEFPDCRGLNYKTIYRRLATARLVGPDAAASRKVRADVGRVKARNYYTNIAEFENWFMKYFASQGKGAENDNGNANLSLAYKLAVRAVCRDAGHKLQDWKDLVELSQDASKLLGYEVPPYSYFYQMAKRDRLIVAARTYRLDKPSHYTKTLPMHRFDSWKMRGFMDCIESDGHKSHENARIAVVDDDGNTTERMVHLVGWAEAKTGFMLNWDLHLNSFNADKVSLSMMKLVRDWGRPERFRFDNGKEYMNERVENAVRMLYTVAELNDDPLRIENALPYRGWQKRIEAIWRQFIAYLKDSPGYYGGDRVSSAKTTLSTKPVPACHNIDELYMMFGRIFDAYNHEVIEVDLDYCEVKADELAAEGQGVRHVAKNIYKARRIDVFNCLMRHYQKRAYDDNFLTMTFGLPEKLTVSRAGVHKTWFGERFLYMPAATNWDKLLPHFGNQVEVRYDPTSEYSLSKMFIFDARSKAYITTVYCDVLRGYSKETADQYNKHKRKINQILREFNRRFATVDVLKDRLDFALQDKTAASKESAGNIIVFHPDAHRFAENRDRDEEVFVEIGDLRQNMSNVEIEWEQLEGSGEWLNKQTGQIVKDNPYLDRLIQN